MWTVSIDILISLIFSLSVLVAVGFTFFYDFLDERSYIEYNMQNLFHCLKCSNIYSSSDQEYCECPKCRSKNIRLKF